MYRVCIGSALCRGLGVGRRSHSAATTTALAGELPLVNPFTRRVVPRSSPGIQQLLAAGFVIQNNALQPDRDGKIDAQKIRSKTVRAAVESLLAEEDGADRIAEMCHTARDSIGGSFMPPKLESLPDPVLEDMQMTVDQATILRLATEGYSMYVGGSAGTGKTILLKAVHRELSARGLKVAMCATTGVAGVHLGGNTFHFAFGAPIGDRGRWDVSSMRVVDTIIIDEVSLLHRRLLEEFNRAAQIARLSDAPFGGIQVILCGDFLQLAMEATTEAPCFTSPLFEQLVQLQLVTTLRQRSDDVLLQILRKLRVGQYDPMLEVVSRDPPAKTSPTYIFPKRRSVIAVNAVKLSALTTEAAVFTPQRGPTRLIGTFTSTCVAVVPRLQRAAFAEVLLAGLRSNFFALTSNAADVVCMPVRDTEHHYFIRMRQPRSGHLYAQTPPIPTTVWAEAVTNAVVCAGGTVESFVGSEPEEQLPHAVHQSGNMLGAEAAALLLKVGCRVMVTRNLSRTVSNGSLGTVEAFQAPTRNLLPTRDVAKRTSSAAKELSAPFPKLPVVRLDNGELIQIPPCAAVIGGTAPTYYYGHELFSLPLQLGYAFTVHKVQGLTIDGPVVVDCEDFFQCPHLVYVACSRVRAIHQLTVKGLSQHKVLVNPLCLEFANSVPHADQPPVIPAKAHRGEWAMRALQAGGSEGAQ